MIRADYTQPQKREAFIAPPGDPEPQLEGIISGTAIVFNTETEIYPGEFEKIDPAAVDNSLLRGDDVRALFNHDANYVLGRSTAGNLRLTKEADGLHFEIRTDPEIGWQRDLCRQIRAGIITNCSFGFFVDKKIVEDRGDNYLYTIKDLTLIDISVVTFPAYKETEAEARSQTAGKPAENPGIDPEITYIEAELKVI